MTNPSRALKNMPSTNSETELLEPSTQKSNGLPSHRYRHRPPLTKTQVETIKTLVNNGEHTKTILARLGISRHQLTTVVRDMRAKEAARLATDETARMNREKAFEKATALFYQEQSYTMIAKECGLAYDDVKKYFAKKTRYIATPQIVEAEPIVQTPDSTYIDEDVIDLALKFSVSYAAAVTKRKYRDIEALLGRQIATPIVKEEKVEEKIDESTIDWTEIDHDRKTKGWSFLDLAKKYALPVGLLERRYYYTEGYRDRARARAKAKDAALKNSATKEQIESIKSLRRLGLSITRIVATTKIPETIVRAHYK